MASIPSFHDDSLVGLVIESEARRITLLIRAESAERGSAPRLKLTFSGVVGYWLTDDTFVNYVYSIEEISPERYVSEFDGAIDHLVKQNGLPRDVRVPARAAQWILEQKIRCFALDASMGLWGWILAREVDLVDEGARA